MMPTLRIFRANFCILNGCKRIAPKLRQTTAPGVPFFVLRLLIPVVVALLISSVSLAQNAVNVGGQLYGETVTAVEVFQGDYGPVPFVATSSNVYIKNGVPDFIGDYWEKEWTAPNGARIKDIHRKHYDIGNRLLVLLDNGDVYILDYNHQKSGYAGRIGSFGSETWEKIRGDALYALSSSHLYVSRDTGITWQIDSAGLRGASIWDCSLDTAQYVYAATSEGLFRQHPDSSAWHLVTSLTYATNLYRVYVDRKNRILVGGNGSGLYLSTDGGSSWSPDTTGIGSQSVKIVADDAFGNLYVVTNDPSSSADHIYLSSGGVSSWQQVGMSLSSSVQSSFSINGLSGDSILVIGTSAGAFLSTDQGTSWITNNNGVRSEHIGGIAKTRSGRILLSNALGIYSNTPPDTVWTKSYPSIGYEGGLTLNQDRQGNFYTLDPALGPFGHGVSGVVKSTDGGASWSPDTIGLDSVQGTLYYVDGAGTQHFGSTFYGNSWNSSLWSKAAGGSWTIDTSGFPVQNYSFVSSMVSDDQSYLYVSGSFAGQRVMRRPLTGGTWMVDTAGIPSTIHYFSKMAGNRGAVVGVAGSSLMIRGASSWNTLPTPSELSYPKIAAVCVDDSGLIFAAFQDYSNIGLGVYLTRDAGATWTYLGLDSLDVGSLVSFGDSTYALTYDAGAFYVGKNPSVTSVVHTANTPRSFALFQNYPNPFNPTTTIQFSIGKMSIVDLKIYDLLGRDVATLAHGEMNAGMHEVSFDASKLASGIYFYRLKAGSFAATRKLVLLK